MGSIDIPPLLIDILPLLLVVAISLVVVFVLNRRSRQAPFNAREQANIEERRVSQRDIRGPLGWFCGIMPIVAIIVSLINVAGGRQRRAFQAIMAPSGNLIWLVLMFSVAPHLVAESEAVNRVFGIIFLIGSLVAPMATLRVLRGLDWPANLDETTRSAKSALKAGNLEAIKDLKLETLITCLGFLDWHVRDNAINAIEKLGYSAVDQLIAALKTKDVVVRDSAVRALAEITKQSFGNDYDAWVNWWQRAKMGEATTKAFY